MSEKRAFDKRLTIFSALWQPAEGGAEKQLREISDALVELGWQVCVIAGARHGLPPREVSNTGVVVRRVSPRLGPKHSRAPVKVDLFLQELAAAPATRPSVVLGSLVSGASLAAMTYGRLRGLPTVLRLGGNDLARAYGSVTRRVQARYIVGSADAIVVNADHLTSQMSRFSVRPKAIVQTIRNGVSGARPSSSGRAPDDLTASRTRVIYYTNGAAAKNDPAFVRLVTANQEVDFRAIGKTSSLPDLPNLERRGWCDDVHAELAWADVVVNTSTFEGNPNFCLQGLATGKPVAGFDNPGIRELAASYPNDVFVVSMDDHVALDRILQTYDWRHHAVMAAIPSVVEAAAEWDRLLHNLLSSPKCK